MVFAYIVLFSLLAWRILACRQHAKYQNVGGPSIIGTYLLPLGVLLVIGIGLAIPFLFDYPSGIGFPIGIRRAYILISHATYAAAFTAVIYLVMSSPYRDQPNQILWSLGAIFLALTLTLGTNLFGSAYYRAFTGSSFLGAPSDISRILLFLGCAACFVVALVRTFRYRSAQKSWVYWVEPLFIVVGLGARLVTAVIPGMAMDTLAWL